MKYNLLKQRAKHESNFTIISNEILFMKDENNRPLSLEELGLFWRILSLPPEWDLNVEGLSTICGCSTNKTVRIMNRLKELGYLKSYDNRDNGKFIGTNYEINETINQELWNTDNKSEIVNSENELLKNPLAMKSNGTLNSNRIVDSQIWKIQTWNSQIRDFNDNKESINKENIDKESLNKESNNKNIKVNSSSNFSSINKNIQKKESPGNTGNLEQNIIEKTNKQLKTELQENKEEKENKKSVHKEKINKIKKSSSKKKNNTELKHADEMLDKKIGDLTKEENKESNNRRIQKEIDERRKELERKKAYENTKNKRITDYIKELFKDYPKLMKSLIAFSEMYKQKRGVITRNTIDLLLDDLFSLGSTESELIEIVNNSIKKSYITFYGCSNNDKNNDKNNFIKISDTENSLVEQNNKININQSYGKVY